MPEKNYILPAALRDALLTYLGTRPYSEVREGVEALEAIKEAETSSPHAE